MKKIFTLVSAVALPGLLCAQSVPTALRISQNDLRGTARFMSMGGAFGALGGDLSALTQNPGGIGIYRSNEIGFTLGLDMNESQSNSSGLTQTDHMTRFNLNNIGGVFTLKLYNNVMPNINFGFTYNKAASFNRRFKGGVPDLRNSMSNYIAGLCNANGLTEDDVMTTSDYDPYNPPYGSRSVPWLAVLGYDALLTNPEGDPDNPRWYGQYGEGTTGNGYFEVNEKGSVDEYNIAIGGNINNVVYWGMDFDITSVDYRIQSVWGESLDNAYVYNPNMQGVGRYNADWALYDNYRVNGTGFNFKLGVIVKPIQELRLGLAFHTPTYYNLSETYSDTHMAFNYPFKMDYVQTWANDGYPASNSFNFKTPWKVIASVAGVIGNNLIVSADYQWDGYGTMRYSDADMYGYYDPWYDWDDPWSDWGGWYGAPQSRSNGRVDYMSANDYANSKIKEIYRDTHTLRLGAEFRVLPSFSIRAGYSFYTSPVTTKAKDGRVEIPGTGVMTNYTLDNTTNYITCGVGYKHKGFYADLAYVYKHQTSEYYPFSPDVMDMATAVKSKLAFNNSQLALSIGYKF
jgi:long-subunit fatty acid transport protein